MSTAHIPTLSDRDQRALERILDGFEKVLSRADAQYSRQRKHQRKSYRGCVSILSTGLSHQTPPQDVSTLPVGWTYSLSQGGVGLVCLDPIQFDEVLIGLHLPDGNIRWIAGRVVRKREVPEERFLDYGIVFAGGK
ncbi:MAG: hypothetical protein SFV23_23530 [Planctomycetaceae bacterium]|nr:hypothetical protein [Planctomycetaceae bacterium]